MRAALAVLARPDLWATALRQALRLSPTGWWRRAPFLPVPTADYLRFRLETQYGSDADVRPGDVIAYLSWCRSMGHLTR